MDSLSKECRDKEMVAVTVMQGAIWTEKSGKASSELYISAACLSQGIRENDVGGQVPESQQVWYRSSNIHMLLFYSYVSKLNVARYSSSDIEIIFCCQVWPSRVLHCHWPAPLLLLCSSPTLPLYFTSEGQEHFSK
jgi:hypothetical protein